VRLTATLRREKVKIEDLTPCSLTPCSCAADPCGAGVDDVLVALAVELVHAARAVSIGVIQITDHAKGRGRTTHPTHPAPSCGLRPKAPHSAPRSAELNDQRIPPPRGAMSTVYSLCTHSHRLDDRAASRLLSVRESSQSAGSGQRRHAASMSRWDGRRGERVTTRLPDADCRSRSR